MARQRAPVPGPSRYSTSGAGRGLAIEVDVSLPGERVSRVLGRLRGSRGLPIVIQADNGPELRGQILGQWAAKGCLN